jgi:TPR repeat protein
MDLNSGSNPPSADDRHAATCACAIGNGHGVPQNYAEAAKWYRLAADQGDAPAQSNVGALYAIGQGVPKNYISAYTWLSLSAAQGNQIAIKRRDIIARHMTPAQIAKAQKLAREWKPTKQPLR